MADVLLKKFNSREEIEKFIPHGIDAIYIDSAESYKDMAIGYRYFKKNDKEFSGHFEDSPILPGIFLIECMAQVSAFCSIDGFNPKYKILGINKVRFNKSVEPGTEVVFKSISSGNGVFNCSANVGQIKVASLELITN